MMLLSGPVDRTGTERGRGHFSTVRSRHTLVGGSVSAPHTDSRSAGAKPPRQHADETRTRSATRERGLHSGSPPVRPSVDTPVYVGPEKQSPPSSGDLSP